MFPSPQNYVKHLLKPTHRGCDDNLSSRFSVFASIVLEDPYALKDSVQIHLNSLHVQSHDFAAFVKCICLLVQVLPIIDTSICSEEIQAVSSPRKCTLV